MGIPWWSSCQCQGPGSIPVWGTKIPQAVLYGQKKKQKAIFKIQYNQMLYDMAQLVKNLPAMQETPVQFLGQEDPLEKEMATHSSILAWEIPWTEESSRLQPKGSQELDMT